MDPDELYTLRNLFWLGSYQKAINEANSLSRCPAHLQTEKQEFIYRSYLAAGQHSILASEISDAESTPVSLRALKLLSKYLQGKDSTVLSQLNAWEAQGQMHPLVQIVTSIVHSHEGNVKDAIKAIYTGANMEQKAMLVTLYLRMDRVDLAQREAQSMKETDEESALSMLAQAWVNLCVGGTKISEAANTYDDLVDKFGGSPLLLNGLAAAKMHQGAFEEAETLLLEALTKISSDADSLANLVVVSQQLRRPEEVVQRYVSQLKIANKDHPLLQSLANFESAFDRITPTLAA